jgi:hypothetical protein
MTTARVTDRQLWGGVATGLAVIAGWFTATHTTLLLAYRGGSLSQVQGICDSGLGQLGRAMSAQTAARCSQVDSYSMWLNVAGFAGLMLAIASAALLAYRAQHQSPSGAADVR